MYFVEPPLLRVDETILALVRRLQQAHRRERRQRLFALPARRRSHEKLARLRRNDSGGKLNSNTNFPFIFFNGPSIIVRSLPQRTKISTFAVSIPTLRIPTMIRFPTLRNKRRRRVKSFWRCCLIPLPAVGHVEALPQSYFSHKSIISSCT